MAVPLNRINNKGVEFTHTGELPKRCIRDDRPGEMFIVKREMGEKETLIWLEVFCHQCFNKEIDDILIKNGRYKKFGGR